MIGLSVAEELLSRLARLANITHRQAISQWAWPGPQNIGVDLLVLAMLPVDVQGLEIRIETIRKALESILGIAEQWPGGNIVARQSG